MQTKLSIITINRNNAEGLRKTIESVFQQTFSDFEYIIVDGDSKDESVDVIKSFNPFKTPFLAWISEPDTGVYQAMNKGIMISKGEYLLFLNSGDFLLDDHVLSDVFSEEHSSDILCGCCNITENGKTIHTTNPPHIHTFSTYFKSNINHQTTFINRNLFETYGLYNENFKYNSDYEFWIRTIILNNCTTKKIERIICEYNIDGISSKENNTEDYKNEIYDILSHPILQKFVPDYEAWQNEKKEMEAMYWVKSHKLLYLPLKWLYKLALLLFSKKK